jgi:hypothetical protein
MVKADEEIVRRSPYNASAGHQTYIGASSRPELVPTEKRNVFLPTYSSL